MTHKLRLFNTNPHSCYFLAYCTGCGASTQLRKDSPTHNPDELVTEWFTQHTQDFQPHGNVYTT